MDKVILCMNKFRQWLQKFMAGRYGSDRLNMVILGVAVAMALIALFVPAPGNLALTVIYYVLTGWAIFRCFSRETYKRFEENRKFLLLIDRIKDRQHKHFTCPKCRQPVRVPRGKGKIAITCPRCKERFIRKS